MESLELLLQPEIVQVYTSTETMTCNIQNRTNVIFFNNYHCVIIDAFFSIYIYVKSRHFSVFFPKPAKESGFQQATGKVNWVQHSCDVVPLSFLPSVMDISENLKAGIYILYLTQKLMCMTSNRDRLIICNHVFLDFKKKVKLNPTVLALSLPWCVLLPHLQI